MTKQFNKVAVLMGGGSSEREISKLSGAAVAKALEQAGYEVTAVLVSEANTFTLPEHTEGVFIALHGSFGEDGGVQRALEQMKIPYTGSDSESSRISFDKVLARNAFEAAGVPVPEGYTLKGDAAGIAPPPWLPFVVKPPCQGSSVGVSIVKNAEDFKPAWDEARKYGDEILVEKYIPGREWTVPVVGTEVLPIVEISPKLDGGWYSWNAKYKSGGTTSYTFPEDDPANAALSRQVRKIALDAFNAVGACGVARVDFRIAPDGSPYVLELNSIPGCTESSILPKSAAKAGMTFPEMCMRIMESAKCG